MKEHFPMGISVHTKSTGGNNTAAVLKSDNPVVGKTIRASATCSERAAVTAVVEKLIAHLECGPVMVEKKYLWKGQWFVGLTLKKSN